jgi:hypothetical protein
MGLADRWALDPIDGLVQGLVQGLDMPMLARWDRVTRSGREGSGRSSRRSILRLG